MESINGIYVYSYHHDDDQQGWIPIRSFSYRGTSYPDHREAPSEEFVEKLSKTLKDCGWEGDGVLGAMVVPPFFAADGGNHWFPIFHVKQENNGTSWIASEYELSIDNLDAKLPRSIFESTNRRK